MDPKKNIHILLADDDDDDRMFFREAIGELALDIDLATVQNGKELMSYLHDNSSELPDIIFLDLNMPIMGGLKSLSQIRQSENLKDIAVVIYSTSTSESDIEECLIRGANIYLRKPTDFDELKALLHKAITVNHHFTISSHSRENFVMVI